MPHTAYTHMKLLKHNSKYNSDDDDEDDNILLKHKLQDLRFS